MAGLGIPVKLLHEGIGHTVTCELKTGEMYRGHLMNCEDNMNAMLEGVTVTGRDGKVTNLEQVYLRGSQIRYFILPDMAVARGVVSTAPAGRAVAKAWRNVRALQPQPHESDDRYGGQEAPWARSERGQSKMSAVLVSGHMSRGMDASDIMRQRGSNHRRTLSAK
ncbi:unnamed protein product [Durusdinium trenchii]|uniref:Small nuclear ribonucleoprotein Sm D3 n=2 Tax=Durusdinium trenchii TaxID=1381693 RepID=A0ABP0MK28_9DINO